MKKIAILCLLVMLALSLTGCNQEIGYTAEFTYAIVRLPDGTVVEGSVDKWAPYGGSEILVKIDGIEYRTNSINVVLINK